MYIISVNGNHFDEWVMIVENLSKVHEALEGLAVHYLDDRNITNEEFNEYDLYIEDTRPYVDQTEFMSLDGTSFWEIMDNQTHVKEVYSGEIGKYNVSA